MSLRRVDKLVREEKYEQALQVLLEVRASQPNNPYLPAYEERLRSAIEIRSRVVHRTGEQASPHLGSQESLVGEFPSVEEQLKAIARPVRVVSEPKIDSRAIEQKRRNEQRRVALLSKIASLISNANEHLEKGDFERALEEVARAKMLDPGNTDIADLEQRIRSSQEEAQRVADEQRQLALQREEQEREQRLRRERDEALKEAEAHRVRDEQARRAAQEQKVALCLRRSREFLGSGLLDEAQAELAFALVLQPDSQEANSLEAELGRCYEERRQAELARQRAEEEKRRKQEEERRREEERVRIVVATAVKEAEEASRRGDFAKALARITEAYIDDPGNPALSACESDILSARDAWARKQKEEALAAEEARRRAREEEERKRHEDERRRVIQERDAQARARQKEEEEQLWYHLRRARTLLSNGKHDQALAEVALAFVVNPFSEEVKQLEAEILLLQGAASIQGVQAPASPTEDARVETSATHMTDEVRGILERATIHGTRREFAKAFEEIARAYALAPMDVAVAECESRIQAAFVVYQEELASPATKVSEQVSRTQDSPARSPRGKSPRRGRHRRLERLPRPAPAPSLKAATSRSGGGSRAARMLMTVIALGAVSVSTVYLVNSNATAPAPPDSTAEVDLSRVPERSAHPPSLESGRKSLREFSQGRGRGLRDFAQNAPAERSGTNAGFTEAAFSPLSEMTELEGRGSDLSPALEESTGVGAQASALGTLDAGGDSLPPLNTDSVSEEPGDLYASSGIPGSALTQAPQILRLSRPQLTEVSRHSEAEEEIIVMVEIGADGAPLQARVVRSTYPPYNHPVIDAVMRSEFQAGLTPSGPAAKWMTIPFRIKP
jgi:hypothetical protein